MSKTKKKKILIIGILILLLLIIITFCLVRYNIYNRDLVYVDSFTIKVGESLPLIESYVDEKEIKRLDSDEIIWNNINVIENKVYNVGKYSGYFTFRGKEIKVSLSVIDNEAPNIEGVQDITIYVNDKIDLLEKIKVTDNSHDEVNIEVSGEYDISKANEYQLSYVATDESGNQTTQDFKLTVKEKVVPNVSKPSTSVTENIVVGTTTNGYTIKRINGIYYINDILIANKTYALPSSYAPGGLLNTFLTAFNEMKNVASSQGISLNIISGYRSYSRQNTLYNNYVNKDGKQLADTYSARAGHSEHQTGLAADINSLSSSFINTTEGKWLNENCYKYGFIIRYPNGKENITGYMYEPWHIRYVGKELANKLYNNGNWISLEEYFGITSQYNS